MCSCSSLAPALSTPAQTCHPTFGSWDRYSPNMQATLLLQGGGRKWLDHRQPIVHVTQGTIDNKDLTRLILPGISALAHEQVLVVVTTGGQPMPPDAEPLPPNVRVADFLPYDLLLPHVDLVVTNGGYGGTQRCLALGVPVIVAVDREDKPEVAARVAWTGAGINLRTGTPPSKAILAAVRKVLTDPSYREAAGRLSAEYSRYSALPAIAEALATTRQRQDLW
jgi:UDP:flavonoid glycosyltransferase YjiC (YdhE family)